MQSVLLETTSNEPFICLAAMAVLLLCFLTLTNSWVESMDTVRRTLFRMGMRPRTLIAAGWVFILGVALVASLLGGILYLAIGALLSGTSWFMPVSPLQGGVLCGIVFVLTALVVFFRILFSFLFSRQRGAV